MKKQIAIFALIGFGLLAVLGTACEPDKITVTSSDGNTLQGITVSGEGKATGEPDIAMLSLGISALRPTVAEARGQAATTMQSLIDSVKSNGVDEKDIQSSQLSIYPEYDYSDSSGQRLIGYRLTNMVTIKVRNIDKTGDVLDGAVAAGGDLTQVQGISFTIDKPDALRDQAREAAVKDAKARAQRLADTAGVKLGAPISIIEGSVSPPIPMNAISRDALGAAAEAQTPIEAGELDIDLTVQVVFAIE